MTHTADFASCLLGALHSGDAHCVPDLAAEATEQAMWENELARRVLVIRD